MKKPSVVLDTNILVSGLIIPKSKPGRTVRLWKQNKIRLIVSSPLLKELEMVLTYPKLRAKYGLKITNTDEFIIQLKKRSNLVHHINLPLITIRDKEDLMVLATAVSGNADFLVTGDKDLLSLKETDSIKPLKILTVDEFLDEVGKMK